MFTKLLLAAALFAPRSSAAPPPSRRTPFGAFHPSCVRGVPSGSYISELASGAARVRRPDGSEDIVARCAFDSPSPRARRPPVRPPGPPPAAGAPCHDYPPPSTCPPLWHGWPKHWWFGLSYASFTNPPLPAGQSVFSVNASWRVPPLPAIRTGNASDPWYQEPPTESWWVGLQGGAVLQPVLELNGLAPREYDAVSWACCAAGMAWYSFPLPALPGEGIVGSIVRVSGAEVGAADDLYVYETVTGVRSAARGDHDTRLFSDMSGAGTPGWAPDWAEVVQESYFVTACADLPCGAGAFADVHVSLAPAGLRFNDTVPADVAAVPWSRAYEIEGAAAPANAVCAGAATYNATARTAGVRFECNASTAQ